MSMLSDAIWRWLEDGPLERVVVALLAVAGVVGVTSPLWRGCTSNSDRMLPVLLGVFALGGAVLLMGLAIHWESTNAPAGRRVWECALALAAIVLLASIVIPSLIGGIDRGKQKRTMGDMRTVATAIESYSMRANRYPAMSASTPAELDALAALLEPTYVKKLPRKDGWDNPFLVRSEGTQYAIVSLGCCGEPEAADPFALPDGGTGRYTADLVFRNGSFVRYPDGTQE